MKTLWGTYPWYEEDGDEKIHPDDRELFKQFSQNTSVFEFAEGEGEYNYFKDNHGTYRIKAVLSRQLPEPEYKFDEQVLIKSKNYLECKIVRIMWHYSKNEYYYFLIVEGKKKSRRYFEDELEKRPERL